MAEPITLRQDPEPGHRRLRFRGDVQRFRLCLDRPIEGVACLRTNIGHARESRQEIIRWVEADEERLGRAWYDIPMQPVDERCFELDVALTEVGHFEAKCLFQQEGGPLPIWPPGPNVTINVAPAHTCSANTLYNAFVRQFGPNKRARRNLPEHERHLVESLDQNGYTVIPPSGTFRDLIRELDFIIGHLGCRFIQLLPITPTPTTCARMGRFGSPYASLSFMGVDPALAEFDPKATPLEQFLELVDEIHKRGAYVIQDIAINHTGWAARLHEAHPEWLAREPDGTIETPGAWGVRWEDLTKLDYRHRGLWQFMAEIFLLWCRRGADGFRCDAGYMIPETAWNYIISKTRQEYPDTIFLLEGLGGKISVTRNLLNRANFNWAYSELFQNYDRSQVAHYLPGALEISRQDGLTIHFAETHDNNRLAARSQPYARMRTALSALCSVSGGFGFANGVEWLATEKIQVHDAPSLSWGAEPNQVADIRRLTTLLKVHPAFFDRTDIDMIQEGAGNCLVLRRRHRPTSQCLLIVANFDDTKEQLAQWNPLRAGISGTVYTDLLSDSHITVQASGESCSLMLSPGQVLCLTPRSEDVMEIRSAETHDLRIPERVLEQQVAAKVLDVMSAYGDVQISKDMDLKDHASRFAENPVAFCRRMNPLGEESRVVMWHWPADAAREVMIPPDHFLLIQGDVPFRARLVDQDRCLADEDSLPSAPGPHVALFSPITTPETETTVNLHLMIYGPEGCRRVQAPLRFLPTAEGTRLARTFRRSELLKQPLMTLGTNGRGGMMRAPVSWGRLNSRYDALLAANLHPDIPVDRWMLLARCRAWVVYQGYTQEISDDCLEAFGVSEKSRFFWKFRVPTGQGQHAVVFFAMEMVGGRNAVRLVAYRAPADGKGATLPDIHPIQIILRPDIEDRSFHEPSKAYLGPETDWPAAIDALADGFDFAPSENRRLMLRISSGVFVHEPEWLYMVLRPQELERGLDPESDLFSPGYLTATVNGGDHLEMTASAESGSGPEPFAAEPLIQRVNETFAPNHDASLEDVLSGALDQFVVQRDTHRTIIAGYPWFLDWGRDSLIVLRGLVAAGRLSEARDILAQFGTMEYQGTLPNMIRGTDTGNRNTSDAPLWFIVTCGVLMDAEGDRSLLDMACGTRRLSEVLSSIGRSLIIGAPSGVRMDPGSGLIFSPSHYTWMDTNHPAGSPRQGYPVEIQAFWYRSLCLLEETVPEAAPGIPWQDLARRVRQQILDRFYLGAEGFLADCLHASPGQPAQGATADDALRPNQLFAITMGAAEDPEICRNVLRACKRLLVPGAIRSLANRPVTYPLNIVHNGKTLNDPANPYQGHYRGDEDTQRKPAYHNGTAWTWMLPTFCEAWAQTYGPKGKQTALAYLMSMKRLIQSGCVGHVPEILDGDAPHRQKGCDAQAWGASELLRVYKQLTVS
ncbi:Putative glycogen debranching enzyme, archaeal type, TIGR01561 [Olavius algarvensis associated proteobacterium Delta 3]|nr:Putative glycogen debranching enzyme, archaeal type, TIGR01561 [Olavius algarvensis associated proteobacterium Delta 3]CAB5145787.1 Putative glycogen debranching enzyme, archaeal type, TIGR01561 [Olavius algarvensis associated proteobacterium Delta 3]